MAHVSLIIPILYDFRLLYEKSEAMECNAIPQIYLNGSDSLVRITISNTGFVDFIYSEVFWKGDNISETLCLHADRY